MATSKGSSRAAALALASLFATGGLVGCGGGGVGGGEPAMAKADAVVVTYYYLPL